MDLEDLHVSILVGHLRVDRFFSEGRLRSLHQEDRLSLVGHRDHRLEDHHQVGRCALVGHLRGDHFSLEVRPGRRLGVHRLEDRCASVGHLRGDHLSMDPEGRRNVMDRVDLREKVPEDRLLMDHEGHLCVQEVRLPVLRLRLQIEHHSEDTLSLIPSRVRHKLHMRTSLHQSPRL